MSEKQYILALDQGTTSSRAILFDRQGSVVATAQEEHRQYYPQPGWVEHDAMEIWQKQLAVARAVLDAQHLDAGSVAAIGITNQRETTVLWDRRTGAPLAPAIVWQDRRTAAHCEALRAAGHAERIRRQSGLEIDAYFSASKLAWLLENVPGARARAERGELAFGTIDSWLVWQLTGGRAHVTDVSNASRTMLYDLHRGAWDDGLLELLDIPPAVLPQVVASSARIGETDAALFGAPIAIAAIAGDQQAATFGQVCLKPGMAKNTYGTGCFLLLNTGDKPMASKHRLLTTVGWQRAGRTTYLLEGSVFMGGAAVQWLRDELGLIARSDDIEALAASVDTSGGVYLVPAHAGLGAPYWDPYARGRAAGPDARQQQGAHRPRDARGNRFPERRIAACHAGGHCRGRRRRRRAAVRTARRRRRGEERPAAAVPGRPARCRRRPPARDRDDCARRRFPRRPRRRLLAGRGRTRGDLASRASLLAAHGERRARRTPGALASCR